MLNPKNDSDLLDYGKLLMPPYGYALQRAVGTTYSLELPALLEVPVALYYSKPLEADFDNDETPADILDSILKSLKTVTVFCQKGKINVPKKYNKLIGITDELVVEITPRSAFSSFHPKCWWLWFKNDQNGKQMVRFIATSRNMTYDRSWDVSFSFDGLVSSEEKEQNKPMVDMLNYLNRHSKNCIEQVYIKQLSKTVFENDLPFKFWKFHPIGIDKKYTNPLADKSFISDTLLMMSPFVDDKTVKAIATKAKNSWLFSRKNELQNLKPETFDYLESTFCIPDIIVNGELMDNMTGDLPKVEPGNLDLHAKLFIGRKGRMNSWFLGSANLTDPAFGRNVECLLELKTEDNHYRPEAIYEDLVSTSEENKLFEEYIHIGKIDEEGPEPEPHVRKLIYDISCAPLTGNLECLNDGAYYCYNMLFDAIKLKVPDDFKVSIQPWCSEALNDFGFNIEPGRLNHLQFPQRLTLSQLSKYFIITITYKGAWNNSFLIKATIDIPDTRHGKILSEIINSKEKFLQYLSFLLSNSGIIDDVETNIYNGRIESNKGAAGSVWGNYSLPLYEDLLKTASQHPGKLRSIDELITKLQADETTCGFISDELIELWSIFKIFIK
ncbi:MAG: phospholipase D family protein [Lentimicrobium sp.]